MASRTRKPQGFTIIELLIVIVVIAILAALIIVTYNGVQNRANDSRRLQDAQEIQSTIEAYKAANGAFPPITPANQDQYGWESSYVTGSFLDSIKSSGIVRQIPVDPVNTSNDTYRYYQYNAGQWGCDPTRGNFYVIEITKFQANSNMNLGPGFSCSQRNWGSEAQWVAGGYTN